MPLAKSFWRAATLSAGNYTTVAAPAGEVYMLGPGGLKSGGAYGDIRICSTDGNAYIDPPNEEKGFFPWTGSAYFKNISASTRGYVMTGPISTLADEGMLDIRRVNPGVLAPYAFTQFPWEAGKAWLMCFWGGQNTNARWRLYGKDDVIDNVQNPPAYHELSPRSGWRPFWLWSDFNLKVGFNPAGGVAVDGIAMAIQYDEASLPEYADRIAVKVDLGPGQAYNLQPQVGELWHIDYVNYPASSDAQWWTNGDTQVNTTNLPFPTVRLTLSSQQWLQLRNTSTLTTYPLLVSGVKERVT